MILINYYMYSREFISHTIKFDQSYEMIISIFPMYKTITIQKCLFIF